MIKFHLFGPLALCSGGTKRPIHSPSQAIVLLSLLLNDGREVSVDALINELWGGAQLNRPDNALQAHISRLRTLVDSPEPDRTASRLVSRSSGYQLRVTDDELDGRVFLAQVRALSDGRVRPSPTEAATQARRALSLWRDPLFGGVVGGGICQSGAVRYERARYLALEALFEAELARGNHVEIVPELSALVAAAALPMTRFCEQLMIALYRSGRQADALAVFYRTRERVSETGIQPLARLQTCTQAILEHNPILLHDRTDDIIRRLQKPRTEFEVAVE